MCCEVVIDAAKLTEPPAVNVLHGGSGIVVFDPHAHAHIFHLEQLPAGREEMTIRRYWY
jgi:hypothetical protein